MLLLKAEYLYKSITGNFSGGGNKQIFGCWAGFSSISKVFHKGLGDGGTVHTWWVQQNSIKGGDILIGKEIPGV